MSGLRIFLILTATFGCICMNVVNGDYYTDESYEDGMYFSDYEHLWYPSSVDDYETALDKQMNKYNGTDTEQHVSNIDNNQIIPEVVPHDIDFVVSGQSDNDTFDPLFLLDMEKHLQAEMGLMQDQLLLLHKLVSSILGPQVTLNTQDNVNPNSIGVNVPLNQGGFWDYNPFTFGFGPFYNDYTDELDGSGDDVFDSWFDDGFGSDDAWNPWFDDVYDGDNSWGSWFQERPQLPIIPDVVDPADHWSNLPSNYSNTTHDIQHVNGSIISVNETINKQTGEDFKFFSHNQVVHVKPDNIVD